MLDYFARIAAQANDTTTCIDAAGLDKIRAYIALSNKRLDAVKGLSRSASCCVADAISGIICENPNLVQAGGPCYPSRKMAACLRDGEIILRYVSYALMAGDSKVINERCIKGLKDTYTALKVDIPTMVLAIEFMKKICVAHIKNENQTYKGNNKFNPIQATKGDCSDLAAECASYFDLIIAAIS